jgi:hypothetical protein
MVEAAGTVGLHAVMDAPLVTHDHNVRCASNFDTPPTATGIVSMKIMSLDREVLLLHLG